MLLVLGVLILDVGDFFVHDSIDKKAEVDADDTDEHLKGFVSVNILKAVGEHCYVNKV